MNLKTYPKQLEFLVSRIKMNKSTYNSNKVKFNEVYEAIIKNEKELTEM